MQVFVEYCVLTNKKPQMWVDADEKNFVINIVLFITVLQHSLVCISDCSGGLCRYSRTLGRTGHRRCYSAGLMAGNGQ